MANNYSPAIADTSNAFLTNDGWKYEFNSELGIFVFNLSLKSAPKSVRFLINVPKDKYTVYAYVPISSDKKRYKGDAANCRIFDLCELWTYSR